MFYKVTFLFFFLVSVLAFVRSGERLLCTTLGVVSGDLPAMLFVSSSDVFFVLHLFTQQS